MAHQSPAMNFLRIGPHLATGGHFTDDGVAALEQQGVSLVIDLRDRPPQGQGKLPAQLRQDLAQRDPEGLLEQPGAQIEVEQARRDDAPDRASQAVERRAEDDKGCSIGEQMG